MFQNPLEKYKKSLKFLKEIKVMHISEISAVHNFYFCSFHTALNRNT